MFFLPITLLPSLVLYHITTKKVFLVQIKALDLTFSTALDQTRISCFAGKFFTSLLSEPPGKSRRKVNYQFSSVTQSCPTLCDSMNCSMPGLPVHHQLPEFTQTHVHRVSNAIQPSHPLSSPSPPAPNPSQHQSLFQ